MDALGSEWLWLLAFFPLVAVTGAVALGAANQVASLWHRHLPEFACAAVLVASFVAAIAILFWIDGGFRG